MRAILASVAALCIASVAAAADDAAKVEDLERVWADSLVSKDIAALDYLLHPEFRLLSLFLRPAKGLDRTGYLEDQTANPAWAFEYMTPVDIDVDLRGEIALATVLMEVGWPDAAPQPGAFRFTDVWVRDSAGWRVISRFSERR